MWLKNYIINIIKEKIYMVDNSDIVIVVLNNSNNNNNDNNNKSGTSNCYNYAKNKKRWKKMKKERYILV